MANKKIVTVPFMEDRFYWYIHSKGMSLHKFMCEYGEYIDRTEKTIRRYLRYGQAPINVVQRIADVINVDVWCLTGRADCKDSVTLLREYERMCISQSVNILLNKCRDCPMMRLKLKYSLSCKNVLIKHSEEAVEIIQKWSDRHPILPEAFIC